MMVEIQLVGDSFHVVVVQGSLPVGVVGGNCPLAEMRGIQPVVAGKEGVWKDLLPQPMA